MQIAALNFATTNQFKVNLKFRNDKNKIPNPNLKLNLNHF